MMEATPLPENAFVTLGYFTWLERQYALTKISDDGKALVGKFITPAGAVHTLHILRDSVDAVVLIKTHEELEAYRNEQDYAC